MTDPLRPSPFGAARRAFLGAAPAPAPEEAAWERLAAAVERAELAPELLALAWEARGWSGEVDPARRDALTLLILGALVAREEGSTRVPAPGAADGAAWWGALLTRLFGEEHAGLPVLAELAGSPPATLIGAPGGRTPLVREGAFLYLDKVHRAEVELAALLTGLVRAPLAPVWSAAALEAALGAVTAPGRPPLASEQARAVRAAVERPLTLISGGPGTGKTWLVVGLLRALLRLGLAPDALALAAPTARAAQRLADAIGAAAADPGLPEAERGLAQVPAPATLHRLLGYHPLADRFRHDRVRPLPARVVVVDEASMIDLELARALLRALRPGARLVLIGDADQLPSVGAGLVLRDLLPGGEGGAVVRLVENHRVDAAAPGGGQVLGAARAINEGRAAALLPGGDPQLVGWREGVDGLGWEGVEAVAGPSAALLPPFLARWEREHLHDPTGDARATVHLRGGELLATDRERVERALARHEQARLLCLTRVGPCGAAALNERLHELALGRQPAGQQLGGGWLAGEPVLVLENDHQLRLWNGEQGVTLWVSEDDRPPRLMALFRRGAGHVAFHLELLQQRIERGYALTVHKAQGSEYRHVAVVLPERDTPLLARELLYTALTRARASVTLLGPAAQLELGLSRAVRRWSGLAERLSGL